MPLCPFKLILVPAGVEGLDWPALDSDGPGPAPTVLTGLAGAGPDAALLASRPEAGSVRSQPAGVLLACLQVPGSLYFSLGCCTRLTHYVSGLDLREPRCCALRHRGVAVRQPRPHRSRTGLQAAWLQRVAAN